MQNFKSILFLAFITVNPICADTIGGEASLALFHHSPAGHTSYSLPFSTGTTADLEETFNFTEEQDMFFKTYIEHPLPFIPNIKIGYALLSQEGSNMVELFSWGDIIDFSGKIDNKLSLDSADLTLYYELLDNWIEVDTGLTFRYMTGDISVNTETEHDTVDFSTLIPMLYGKARFNFPVTDISLQLEANAITYAGLTSYDYELSARYTLAIGLGIEAGYKVFHLDADDLVDGFKADMDFSGPYAAAIWDF